MKKVALVLIAAALALAAVAGTVVWGNGAATTPLAADTVVWGN